MFSNDRRRTQSEVIDLSTIDELNISQSSTSSTHISPKKAPRFDSLVIEDVFTGVSCFQNQTLTNNGNTMKKKGFSIRSFSTSETIVSLKGRKARNI